jgi:ParB family transcriptional regulator, chromosome partitioning protein
MSAPKRKALGRGLAALIPGAPAPGAPTLVSRRSVEGGRDGIRTIAVEEIHPSPGQPRTVFDDARLDELAASIKTQGIIQPVIVRARGAHGEGAGYELIAGERRWRAAQRAGLHEVPAVVRDVAPTQAFEMALVENLQREDLNPLEEAAGYQRLVDEFGYTQEQLSERVGKDRSTVANALRLLRLPEGVRGLVAEGRLSMGHARALLGLEAAAAMEKLARRIVAGELSVRKVEELVRRARSEAKPPTTAAAPAAGRGPSLSARDLSMRLTRTLGTRVDVVEVGQERGQIAIHYHSLDQLDALLERLLPA